jgi:AraC family transcriptional regulator
VSAPFRLLSGDAPVGFGAGPVCAWRIGGREGGLATALAVHLLREYGNGTVAPDHQRGGLPLNRLRRVLEYIDSHLGDELSLAELAAISGFSANHFASALKASTALSPPRLVIKRRIHRARQLLAQTKLPISEVAYVVGFSSQSHLTVNFRRIVGLTPVSTENPKGLT